MTLHVQDLPLIKLPRKSLAERRMPTSDPTERYPIAYLDSRFTLIGAGGGQFLLCPAVVRVYPRAQGFADSHP